MADEKITTILQVELDAGRVASDLNELSRQIANVKNEQKQLDDEYKSGKITLDEYVKSNNAMKDELTWLQKEQKGLVATTKLLTSTTDTYTDSLNGERQKLADMQKAYDQLDASFRESDGGKKFLEELQAQSEKVKQLEGDTGRFQRDVGNYPKALQGAIPAFDKVNKVLDGIGVSMQDLQTKGMKSFSGLGQSLKNFGKAFMTPPIIVITAVLSAILLVVDKVREAFKKNDNAMTALQKAFAVFKPIGEAVGKVFNAVAEGLAKVATAAADAVGWIAGKLSPAYKQAADDAQKLVERQDQLEESERNAAVNAAARNAKVAQLRDKAAQSEKYSLEERKKALEEAIQLEQKNLEEAKIIARERLKILEAEAKQNSDTSDEMQNKIAEARAAMYAAEESYYSGTRRLNSQLTAFDKEERQKREQNAAEARKKREEDAKAEEQAEKERAKNAMEIEQMAEDFALSLIQDESAKAIAQRKIQGDREIAQLKERLATEKNLTAESREQLAQLIKDKQAALDKEIDAMATEAANAKTEAELEAERERTQRILELKIELAEEGSEEWLELQKELLEKQMEQELDNLELSEEEKNLIRDKYREKQKQLDDEFAESQKKQNEDIRDDQIEGFKKVAQAASTTFGALSSMLKEYGKENEAAQKAAKAFGVMQIIADQAISIANTAKAITDAVSGATAAAARTGPAAPFVLAGYIAGMVGAVVSAIASVASSIAQAKQLIEGADAGNYATGGVVGGSSYSGDRLIAHVNSGEGIYTGTQANNLLQEIANNPARGGFDIEAYAQATAAAVAAQPAPVVVYSEMQEFGQKVGTYNEIASI